MSSDKETEEGRFYGLELGVVVSNADPMGLGRVTVRVPGIIDEESGWAPPLGTIGGGSPQRGFHAVPDVGADVGVLFHRGDRERPYYLAGHWGKPKAGSEMPTPVRDAPAEDAARIKAFETARWLCTYDDRPGLETLRLEDKASGDRIEMDGVRCGITIQSTVSITLRTQGTIDIDALNVNVAGRPVVANGKPIQ